MAKYTSPVVLDTLLDEVATADRVVACSGQPATYAEATTGAPDGKMLGSCASAPGSYTKAASGTGRKLSMAELDGGTVDASGDVDHLAWVDDDLGRLLHVTTVPARPLVAGDDLEVAALDVLTIAQPT